MILQNKQKPSEWIKRFSSSIKSNGCVIDIACGSGRNAIWLAEQGFDVTGLDIDEAALENLKPFCKTICADIENAPWPLSDNSFDAVIVTNYLWRPNLQRILDTVNDGGVLLYETFARGNESIGAGRPSRPDFLLTPNELLNVLLSDKQHWHVIAYEDGFMPSPDRVVQKIAAKRA